MFMFVGAIMLDETGMSNERRGIKAGLMLVPLFGIQLFFTIYSPNLSSTWFNFIHTFQIIVTNSQMIVHIKRELLGRLGQPSKSRAVVTNFTHGTSIDDMNHDNDDNNNNNNNNNSKYNNNKIYNNNNNNNNNKINIKREELIPMNSIPKSSSKNSNNSNKNNNNSNNNNYDDNDKELL
ncbi:hypothetical protein HELRODRAFT_165906 [Helobdella robusta]|uniref:Uncharacterized protein n=1 Tax=Helobdella robusta TaxID=6412 RepID=T1EXF5_HELRO|nr:hypothetical protein HELRODRAFT_165906 [Helobdella robusta]ESN91824.1 hypothetical protein HELRODRAFT_165906 [Helobdella robusta]